MPLGPAINIKIHLNESTSAFFDNLILARCSAVRGHRQLFDDFHFSFRLLFSAFSIKLFIFSPFRFVCFVRYDARRTI